VCETFNIDEYSIKKGSVDIVKTKLLSFVNPDNGEVPSDDSATQKLEEVFKEIRVRIGTLLKTDNLSFLIGAGASIGAGGVSLATIPKPLENSLILQAKKEMDDGEPANWINLFYNTVSFLGGIAYNFRERSIAYLIEGEQSIQPINLNLEDYLSHLHMWLAGLGDNGCLLTLKIGDDVELKIVKGDLQKLIYVIIHNLILLLNLPIPGKQNPLRYHRWFIKKVLTRPLNLRRANLFTLNYDTLIEQSADAEGAFLVDGFIGTLRRVFRPESYDLDFYFPAQTTEGQVHRFDRALHLYKLHGSITWHRCEQSWENPYGLYASYFNQNCPEDDVLIYPSPLKYGQALGLPYFELFRRFGNVIAQPQSVLFTIGYGFGDEHVNALIRQALAIPSFTLVVVDPNPQSKFIEELEKQNDERIWIIKGLKLGTFEQFVQKLMPDLHEEEIETKVIKTYKALLSVKSDMSHNEEQKNG
jgi:hypothetical protein